MRCPRCEKEMDRQAAEQLPRSKRVKIEFYCHTCTIAVTVVCPEERQVYIPRSSEVAQKG
jgi:hypothetical protein